MNEEVTKDVAALEAMVSYQFPIDEAFVETDISLVVEFNVSE